MNKNDFYEEMTEILELDDTVNSDSPLNEENGFDSLAILTLIAFVDENFDMSLSGEALGNLTSIKQLMSLIGDDKFK